MTWETHCSNFYYIMCMYSSYFGKLLVCYPACLIIHKIGEKTFVAILIGKAINAVVYIDYYVLHGFIELIL